MKLAAVLAPAIDLCFAIRAAFLPTLRAVIRSPSLLWPNALSRLFMSHVWVPFGDGVDAISRAVKLELIPGNARGVVLDIGAGT
jgi:hypothetical protein